MPADWFLQQSEWISDWQGCCLPSLLGPGLPAAGSSWAWFPPVGDRERECVCAHLVARLTHFHRELPGSRQLPAWFWGDGALLGKSGCQGMYKLQRGGRIKSASERFLSAQPLASLQTPQSGWWHDCFSHQPSELVRWKVILFVLPHQHRSHSETGAFTVNRKELLFRNQKEHVFWY